jgi:hypothetical protein
MADTATVHLSLQGVRSGRSGVSRAQWKADGGRNRNRCLSPWGVRSGRGGNA